MPLPAALPLTRGLASFASSTREVPSAALQVARDGITDAIGLMIAARNEDVVRIARDYVLEGMPQGSSTLLLTLERTRARDAAFVNASAVHAFAMDDVAWSCHPSAVLMPAALALAEQKACSGMDLLRAWVIGYEVIAELATREGGSWHSTAWHPTGMVGPVAAAAASASMLRLTEGQAQAALGIAASSTGGLSANFGTQTKALHAAHAARAGVEAAELAALAVTASPVALEDTNGLLRAISPEKKVDVTTLFDPARPPWRILAAGLSLKKYPLCYSLHRVTDAAVDLGSLPRLEVKRIVAIDVWLGVRQAAMARHVLPATELQARYSAPFAVASGLLARAAGFAQLRPSFFESHEVRRLIGLTRLHTLDEVGLDDPVFAPADRVQVTLDDGAVLDSGEVRFARGHASLPMTGEQLRAKFMEGTAVALGEQRAAQLFDALQGLETMTDVRELARLAVLPPQGIASWSE